MPCLSPVSIPVYKIEPQSRKSFFKDESGLIHSRLSGGLMKVKHYIQVPCGKCPACLKKAQSSWAFRIEQEVLSPWVVSSLFVTLTYAPAFLPSDKSVHKEDVQLFLKRLRSNLSRANCPVYLRYYCCGEYGDLYNRPHYHLIVTFNRSVDWLFIQKAWSKGIVDIAPFTPARAGYVAKYSLKQFGLDYSGLVPPFRLCSKGLGKWFLKKYKPGSFGYVSTFANLSGVQVPLHRYYIDKLFPHYKRTYEYKELGVFGRVRVSFREDVSTFHRTLYLLQSQRRFDAWQRLQSSQHHDGYRGFLNSQSLGMASKLSFSQFSLIEKLILNRS